MITTISIEPGKKSHKVIFRFKGRTIVQYVRADIPAEIVQTWAEKLYSKLLVQQKRSRI